MKTILTITALTIILSACGGDNAPSVLEYLHDPALMKTNDNWCMVNPTKSDTAICKNLNQARFLVARKASSLFDCTESRGKMYYDYTPKHDCINEKAKLLGIK